MDKYSRKAAREGGFFAWSELRDVEDAVPYGRTGQAAPTMRDVEDAVPYGRTGSSAPTQCKEIPL